MYGSVNFTDNLKLRCYLHARYNLVISMLIPELVSSCSSLQRKQSLSLTDDVHNIYSPLSCRLHLLINIWKLFRLDHTTHSMMFLVPQIILVLMLLQVYSAYKLGPSSEPPPSLMPKVVGPKFGTPMAGESYSRTRFNVEDTHTKRRCDEVEEVISTSATTARL